MSPLCLLRLAIVHFGTILPAYLSIYGSLVAAPKLCKFETKRSASNRLWGSLVARCVLLF